jgi:signal transduction histidine kinase
MGALMSIDLNGAHQAAKDSTAVAKPFDSTPEHGRAEVVFLHELTHRLLGATQVESALREVLDAAIDLGQADFGDIHLLHAPSGRLRLAAQRGLTPDYLVAFGEVGDDHVSACGRALRTGRPVVIEDVDLDDAYTSMRQLARQTGYRAVHATPLRSESNELLGVLSLHFRRPCRPPAGTLRMLHQYAQQAANVIQRLQAEEQLRTAYQEKKRFIAMLAHELRGPLGTVRTSIEVLSRPNLPVQAHEHAIAIARRQLGRVSQLVDDLFDLERLGESKLRLKKKRVPMKEVVQAAMEVAQEATDAANIEVRITIEPSDLTVFVDPVRFSQILANLLDNAAKFTPAGGYVHVDCRECESALRIQVEDNGVGMAPAIACRVFDMFEQAADEVDKNRGLGLGLPISKRIAEMHGGTISAHSDGPARGSRFTVTIPQGLSQPESAA